MNAAMVWHSDNERGKEMSEKFNAKYSVDDGYAGASRPQHFHIDESEVEDDMDQQDLRMLYSEMVLEDVENKVSAYGENEEEFISWAKEVIASRDSD